MYGRAHELKKTFLSASATYVQASSPRHVSEKKVQAK